MVNRNEAKINGNDEVNLAGMKSKGGLQRHLGAVFGIKMMDAQTPSRKWGKQVEKAVIMAEAWQP